MPRRKGARFSKLFEKLRGTGGNPPTTGPTGEFYKYLTGVNKITMPNAIPAAARELVDVGVIPFATTPNGTTAGNRYLVGMTAYSYNGLRTRAKNFALADFGIYIKESGEKDNDNYFPALLRCSYSRSGATTNPNKVSAITKEPYSYTPRRTFAFPVGRTIAVYDAEEGTAETAINEVDEFDVVKTLTGWLKAGKKDTSTATVDDKDKAISVSYDPEKFAPARSNEAAPNAAIDGVVVD